MTDFTSTGIELESRETEHVLRQEAAERLAAIADRLSAGGRFEFMIKGERLRVPTGDGLRFKRELTSSPATTSGWRGRSAPTSASTSAGPSPARRSTCLTTRRLAPRCRKSRNSDAAAGEVKDRADWSEGRHEALDEVDVPTHRVPFFHSRPSRPLIVSALTCVTIGVLLPFSRLADTLGFTALPAGFMATLVGLVVVYFVLVELAKRRFYRTTARGRPLAGVHRRRERRIQRRASRWSARAATRRRLAPA